MPTHYEVLGVPKTATLEQIKKRFRELIRELHPDSGGPGGSALNDAVQAYRILSDPEKRRAYDQAWAVPVWTQNDRTVIDLGGGWETEFNGG